MTTATPTAVHPLVSEAPEFAAMFEGLYQHDKNFASQADEYTAVLERLASASADDRELLELQRDDLKTVLLREVSHASGSCCGGCGG